MFKSLLIANRGEIACRIIRTAKALGIKTFAIYSDLDRKALHVQQADRAICVGPTSLAESYLNIEKIIQVATKADVEAIHPGYGFLSENPEFASACNDVGIVFVGPSPQTLADMASKETAKRIAQKAGVSIIPGYAGEAQDDKALGVEAMSIGYPLMIKASMGGGGKGMRLVEKSEEFPDAVQSCKRETLSAFGDQRVILEKYIPSPRHIEIQVFGDTHGNHIHLYERDCSPQRRHQKIIEEAPAVGIDDAVRQDMYAAALKVCKAVDYVGAGTVEFLLDPQGQFYFMEMNTRLQVEHPVTEVITGLDLVEWQLRVAAGEVLPRTQDEIGLCGHALEARIYAENPSNNFMPSSGKVGVFKLPSAECRIDTGIQEGDVVHPNYDPMLAKLIVGSSTRQGCLHQAKHIIESWPVLGVTTNLQFLASLLDDPDFQQSPVDVGFVDRHIERWTQQEETPIAAYRCAAVGLMTQPEGHGPWGMADGWRLNVPAAQRFLLEANGKTQTVELTHDGHRWWVDNTDWIEVNRVESSLDIQCSKGVMQAYVYQSSAENVHVCFRGKTYSFVLHDPLAEVGASEESEHRLTAPMTSTVAAIYVKPGESVKQGHTLMILEAMKMEHSIRAPSDGVVGSVYYSKGDVVEAGNDLLEFEGGGDDSPLARAS